jgi:hypothetical protein
VASSDIFWNGNEGFDIHLLPGETSSSLLDLLVIEEDTTPPTRSFANSPPADVATITFTPNFFSILVPPENGGVKVDTSTGQVTVPAAPTLTSFVIEAAVTTKPPNVKTLGPIPIRVLVHTSIEDIWLTPSPLTIRRGADGLRFTVLARFDDDTVGDITRRPNITWVSSDATKVAVDATGALSAGVNQAPPLPTITATHAGRTDTATVQVKQPWSTPVAVTLVPGSAGVAKAAEVPNILFLPEGFTAAEKPKFEALVRALVTDLQSTPSLRPYDLLKEAANFWMAFVPSRERGTSALYDMRPVTRKTVFGAEIPDPVKPAPGDAFTLANLIYHVGLPTPADASVGPLSARGAWVLQYGLAVAGGFSDDVYAEWQALHDHRLANERDSAFGIKNGQRPTMHNADVPRVMDFHPLRTTRAHLDDFVQKLTFKPGGPMIGSIWATQNPAGTIPDPSDPQLPAGLKVGQDRPFVFMLAGGARYGGTQMVGLIVSSLRSEDELRVASVAGTRQFAIVPYDLPSTVSLDFVSRVAHETAHAFGLEDEYGEFDAPLRIPASDELRLKPAGNVQPASELAKSDADPTLDPAKLENIKWLWPRIEHAGVLAQEPDPGALTFDIRLRPSHAVGFSPGDIVKLRRRPLVDHPKASGRLAVVAVTGDTDTVTAAPLPFSAIDPADWPAGSVLIRPVRGSPTFLDPLGPDLPLVAPIIARHLATTGIPLNLPAPPPAPKCGKDKNPMQIAENLPAGRAAGRPRYRAQIVGLYDGGVRFFCGVYHPSGVCVMRRRLVPDEKPRTYLFCPVCRYVMVDKLDPTKHSVIDIDYQKRYPEP